MKKREKTANLVNESELLENQNIDLKSQIQDLEKQKRELMDMLSMHSQTCVKNNRAANAADSGSLQNHQQFQDFVSDNEQSYITNFDGNGNFNDAESDFEIGSTNGTNAMNPYSKDPNFAKLIDLPQSSPYGTKPYERSYTIAGYNPETNYYQQRQKSDDNRVSFVYPSDEETLKKSGKYVKSKDGYRTEKKTQMSHHHHQQQQQHEFRTNFQCNDDADSYRPNGIIDGNFFANRTDIFSSNDYTAAFGTNPLDNGCMA